MCIKYSHKINSTNLVSLTKNLTPNKTFPINTEIQTISVKIVKIVKILEINWVTKINCSKFLLQQGKIFNIYTEKISKFQDNFSLKAETISMTA